MVSLPSSFAGGSTSYLLILFADVLVFLLIGLAFRLLKPRKISGTIWIGPIFHLYTLGAVFLALFAELGGSLSLSVLSAYGSFLVAAVLGSLLGVGLGRRIPVTVGAEGKMVYTGGKLLVALLVFLLLPLALEQAVVLFGSLAGVMTLVNALDNQAPFTYILVAVGFLFVLGTFLSLTWRGEVWKKRSAPTSPSPASPGRK